MSIQRDPELLDMSSPGDEGDIVYHESTAPPPTPESREAQPGELPTFDDGILGRRAWVKLVLWSYHLTVCRPSRP